MRHTRSLSLPRECLSLPRRTASESSQSSDSRWRRDGRHSAQADSVRLLPSSIEAIHPVKAHVKSGQAESFHGKSPVAQAGESAQAQLPFHASTSVHSTLATPALPEDNLPRKRLRGIIDTIEEVLLARVQLRHSRADLKSSRKFLVRSMQALESRSTSRLQTFPAQRDNSSIAATLVNRFRNLRSPSPATAARSSSNADSGFTIHNDTASTAASSDHIQTLSSLLHQYRLDVDHVHEHELSFEADLDKLSNIEYRLEEKLKSLLHDFQDRETATRMLQQLSERTEESSQSARDEGSEDDLPPLVEEYFSKTGDVGVYIERLQELNFLHAEGQIARDLIKDRGDPLEVSDEQFIHNYESHRANIEADIHAASAEVAVLADRCRAAGYDTEQYRTARKSETAGTLSPVPSLSALTPYNPVHIPHSEMGPLATSASIMAGQSSQRIDSWLRTVEGYADDAGASLDTGLLGPDEPPNAKDETDS